MHYFKVLVGEASYHGEEALTYSSTQLLAAGTVVRIPLRKKLALGIITEEVSKPSFVCKAISEIPQDLPPLAPQLTKLIIWMKQFYPSPLGVITQQLLPRELPKKPETPLTLSEPTAKHLPPLTTEQKAALDKVQLGTSGAYLLHGETGTGKTRVYIELAIRSVAQRKSAIILTPEIGLTSHLSQDFQKVFGDRVIVLHSQLTEATRHRLWTTILRQSDPVIVIGPRSALFAPLHNVGFIAVDESHETAYKQDQSPYYHASRVASKLGELYNAPVVLGSATPLVTDYFMAKAKQRPILRMTQVATQDTTEPDDISVIDLRDKSKFTKRSHLSDELLENMHATLARGEQILLFLNRRGTARVVLCDNCGWQALCPNCDLPLVYHSDSHNMRCHSCNYNNSSPVSCPECRSTSVIFKSIGTKAIELEVQRLFPDAPTMRFDTDNKKAERIEQHISTLKKGHVSIIIGTQTIVKGLDLPKLSLVGVIAADTSLYFPDFSASERTFQLLSQVIGRIGRGHRRGKAVIQTYHPDSHLLKAVLRKDWETFYEKELQERKTFLFPPFCYLLKLTCRRSSKEAAQKNAEKLAHTLRNAKLHIKIEGPAPAFHEKFQNKFQWQIVIKAKKRQELVRVIGLMPSGWTHDIDPMNLL